MQKLYEFFAEDNKNLQGIYPSSDPILYTRYGV